MNTKLIAISSIVVILAAVMIVGCVEKGLPISNVELKNIADDALNDVADRLEDIETARDNSDFVTAKTELATFDTALKQYITEFKKMKVAENALPYKKALISFFKDLRTLGVYIDAYMENPTIDGYLRIDIQAVDLTNQMEIIAMLEESL